MVKMQKKKRRKRRRGRSRRRNRKKKKENSSYMYHSSNNKTTAHASQPLSLIEQFAYMCCTYPYNMTRRTFTSCTLQTTALPSLFLHVSNTAHTYCRNLTDTCHGHEMMSAVRPCMMALSSGPRLSSDVARVPQAVNHSDTIEHASLRHSQSCMCVKLNKLFCFFFFLLAITFAVQLNH